ncbi:MAG: TolC family protein [Thermodesulfobacteriota bacterium]
MGAPSPELNALMARALEYNTDLLAGVQRVEQARASLKIRGDAATVGWVRADADWSKTVRTSGRNSSDTFLQTGVDVSYELDLFGANRAQVLAAEAGLDSSIYDQGALELAIMGDVATGYFTLASLRERLALADANLDISREVLRIITARVREGAESEIDLAQQRTAVASTEAARADRGAHKERGECACGALGAPPQTITVDRENLDGVNVPDGAGAAVGATRTEAGSASPRRHR